MSRFGKSMVVNILVAYYGKNNDFRGLFRGLKIAQDETFEKHLDFLRLFIKGKSYVAHAYITGILLIKKYGELFALNMFMSFL